MAWNSFPDNLHGPLIHHTAAVALSMVYKLLLQVYLEMLHDVAVYKFDTDIVTLWHAPSRVRSRMQCAVCLHASPSDRTRSRAQSSTRLRSLTGIRTSSSWSMILKRAQLLLRLVHSSIRHFAPSQ